MEEERYIKMIFTSSEWLYILASLGLSSKLMLFNPFAGLSKEALQEEIIRGRRGLEEKRMLQHTVNHGWELDGRIVALVDLVINADYTLSIVTLSAPASLTKTTYMFMKNQAISMVQESRYYHFGIYRGEKAVLNVLLAYLGVGQQISQNLSSIRLPTDNLPNLILTGWSDSEKAQAHLREAGFTEQDARTSADILSKSDKASILTPELKDKPLNPLHRSILLSGKTFLYWGETETPTSDFIQLDPLPFSHTAITKAPDFDETILFEPSTPNITAKIIRLINRGEFNVGKSTQEESFP